MSLLAKRRSLFSVTTSTPDPDPGGGSGQSWVQSLGQTSLTKPTPLSTVQVSNWTEYQNAVASAIAGTHIVFQNDITTSGSYTHDGVNGTAVNPIVIDMNGYKLVTGESAPASSASGGSVHPYHHINCSYLWYWRPHWDGNRASIWGPTFGARYGTDPTVGDCSFVTIAEGISEGSRQQGMLAARSSNFTIDGFEVRNWATMEYQPNASGQLGLGSTAIYLGMGSGASAVAWSVDTFNMRSIWVHDIGYVGSGHLHTGMAIQVKHNGRNVTIREFLAENMGTRAQGALNLNYDDTTSVQTNNLVEDFIIRDIRRFTDEPFGGDAVTVGADVTLRRGVLYDLDSWGIEVRNAAHTGATAVTIDQMTIYDTAQHASAGAPRGVMTTGQFEAGSGATPVLTVTNSIAPSGGQYVAVEADFVGPVTGTADAGSGTASGFELASDSLIPETAGALGKESSGSVASSTYPMLTPFWDEPDLATSYPAPPSDPAGSTVSVELTDNDGTPRTLSGLTIVDVSSRAELDAALVSPNNKLIRVADGSYGAGIGIISPSNCVVWCQTYNGAVFDADYQTSGGDSFTVAVGGANNFAWFGGYIQEARNYGFLIGGEEAGAPFTGSLGAWSNVWAQWISIDGSGQEGFKLASDGNGTTGSPRVCSNVNIRYCNMRNLGYRWGSAETNGNARFGEGIYTSNNNRLTIINGVSYEHNYVTNTGPTFSSLVNTNGAGEGNQPQNTGAFAEVIDFKERCSGELYVRYNFFHDVPVTFPTIVWFQNGTDDGPSGFFKANRMLRMYSVPRPENPSNAGADNTPYNTNGHGIQIGHGMQLFEDNLILGSSDNGVYVRVGAGRFSDAAHLDVPLNRNVLLANGQDYLSNGTGGTAGTVNITRTNNVVSDSSISGGSNTSNADISGLGTISSSSNMLDSGAGPLSAVRTEGLIPSGSYFE